MDVKHEFDNLGINWCEYIVFYIRFLLASKMRYPVLLCLSVLRMFSHEVHKNPRTLLIISNAHFVNNVQEMSRARIILYTECLISQRWNENISSAFAERAAVAIGIQFPGTHKKRKKECIESWQTNCFYWRPHGHNRIITKLYRSSIAAWRSFLWMDIYHPGGDRLSHDLRGSRKRI